MGEHGKHRSLVIGGGHGASGRVSRGAGRAAGGRFRPGLRGAACVAALSLAAAAAAPASACRLALALALDVSSSVDAAEYQLQSEGLARALEDADVQAAILAPGGPVALAIYEWSGRNQQAMVSDWVTPATPAEIDALAARIRGFSRSHAEFPTALGYALGYGAVLLGRSPFCVQKTLDVSGDGANNDGFEPHLAYNAFDFRGVTVNALVVGGSERPALVRYFQTIVIHGAEAFTELADDYGDYAVAMRRKLLRELKRPLIIGALE